MVEPCKHSDGIDRLLPDLLLNCRGRRRARRAATPPLRDHLVRSREHRLERGRDWPGELFHLIRPEEASLHCRRFVMDRCVPAYINAPLRDDTIHASFIGPPLPVM